jgi:predicted molibdopterin-dependent oxidoreductase YjgC
VLPAAANTVGLRAVGVEPTALPGGAAVTDTGARKALRKLFGANLAADAGPARLMEAAKARPLRCLYLVGGDPLGPGGALEGRCDEAQLVIYQGTNANPTSERADFVLPAAAFCEAAQSFANLEWRLQTSMPCFPPPGQARAGFTISEALHTKLGGRGRADLAALRKEIAELGGALRAFAALGGEEADRLLR